MSTSPHPRVQFLCITSQNFKIILFMYTSMTPTNFTKYKLIVFSFSTLFPFQQIQFIISTEFIVIIGTDEYLQ